MAQPPNTIKVLQQSMVAPPIGSVPTISLPMTASDLFTANSCPVQWLGFYDFPHSTQNVIETIVPSLKNSLSLALKLFFPFAGNFMLTPPPTKPYILYTDGNSIPFTVSETLADLDHLILFNCPRVAEDVHPFVPKLAPPRLEGNPRVFPLMALQVTIFPNIGFCVGVSFSHIVSDGATFTHFMKTWASICKNGEDYVLRLQNENSLPFYDRSLLNNMEIEKRMEPLALKFFWDLTLAQKEEHEDPSHGNQVDPKYRFTFVMDGAQIERLKRWVKNQFHRNDSNQSLYFSTYAVTCALTWVCFLKSQVDGANSFSGDEDGLCNFFILANNRNLLENIPNTYFGNCLQAAVVPMKKRDLLGANGIAYAAKAIGKEVWELKNTRKDLEPEKVLQDLIEASLNQTIGVAGSPKFGLYEIDFGWGRPKMMDFVHIEFGADAFSLCDMRDDKYGIQVTLVESRAKLEHFKALLEESLRMINSATIDEEATQMG
ncbi:hypothetical protein UlMin_012830 [Ulmus minor]